MDMSVSPGPGSASPREVAASPWNVPNILTWVRIAAIPLVVLAFYAPYKWADPAAGLIFAAAGITDSLDGYLARRLGQMTRLGAFLDPVADKLIVATALVLLVARDPRAVVVLMAVVIIGREIAISALREWMAELGQGLAMMLYRSDFIGLPIYRLGLWLSVAAAVLTLVSMLAYLKAAWPDLRG